VSSLSTGECGAMTSAKAATSTSVTITAKPATAPRLALK
jgi:hypothetical protein